MINTAKIIHSTTGDYRCRFKDALIATGITGFGRMLNAAGTPPDFPMDADAIELFRGYFFDGPDQRL